MKTFIERIFSICKNKKNIAIAMLVACISLISSGIIMLVYSHSFGNQQLVLNGEQRSGDNALEWSSDGKSFTTLSNDSYICFGFDDSIDMERLVINYSNQSAKPWRVQVFYATPESEFNQDDSISQNVAPTNDSIALNFTANNVNAIRIDWGDDAGRTFSLNDIQLNFVNRSTKIVLLLLVFLMILVIGSLHVMLDTERGFKIDFAVKRLVIRNAIADILFLIMTNYWMFWEKGGDYILFCNLFLIFSAVNIIDYIVGIPFHWNEHSVKKESYLRSFHAQACVVIMMVVYAVLLFNVTKGAGKIATFSDWNSFILNIFIGIAVYIFSIEYMFLENRAFANFIVIVIAALLTNYAIQGFSTYYVCAFFLFSTLMLGIEEKKIENKILLITVLLVLATYILSLTNTYEAFVNYTSSGSFKRTLGFLNSNGTSLEMFYMALMFAYIHNGNHKKKLIENLFVLILSCFAILSSGGRTSLIGNVWLIAVTISFIAYGFLPCEVKARFENRSIVLLFFAQGIPLICAIGSFYSSWIYDGNANSISFRILGMFFNTRTYGLRLEKAYNILHNYIPKIWGQYIPDNIDGESLFIENAYVDMLLRAGIVLFVCYMIILSIMNIRLWKRKQYYRMLLLISISIVAMSEDILLNPINNVIAFIVFSNIERYDNDCDSPKVKWYKKLLAISIIAFSWIISFKMIVSILKTCIEGYRLSDLSSMLIVTLVVLIAAYISKKAYLLLMDLLEKKPISQIGKIRIVTLAVELLLLFIIGFTGVWAIEKDMYGLNDEIQILKLISDNSKEKIYADKLPIIYGKKISGVKYSLRTNDLQYKSNVTIITNAEDDKAELFSKGFLYMPISDTSAIYTNNDEVIELLQDNGYHLYGYNSYAYCVDLQYEAELNDIELNDEEKIVLKDEKNLLNKGPYISLGAGKYTVSFELHMDELLQNEDEEVAVVSVSNGWGQSLLGEQVITADMFDHNGDCECDLQINGNGSGYEFKVTLSSDVTLLVEEIKYVKTPDFDTHYLVDGKWRRIHEEYYDLEGNSFERNEGYYGADYKYDEVGNVVKTTYLGIDGQPITLLAGQASVEYEYDEKGNTSGYKYYDVAGNPVLYDGKYWYLKRIFNDNKQIVREEYFGIDGNPISLSGGQWAVEYEYDEAGNIVVYRYYDTSGNPVLYAGNYWCYKRTFNEGKQMIFEEYFGTDGEPIALSDGACAYSKEYDDAGNISKTTYLGSDGAPITNTSGYSAWRRYYNDSKQVIREDYYDENDDPLTLSGGQGAVEYEYDENGNRSVYRYYDVNGEPVLYGGIYWGFKVTYDQNNRNVLEEYFGLDGQPIIRSDGASGYTREYDEAGNVIKITYLDVEGNPTTNTSGYSIVHRSYNAQNKVEREEYYDTNENPITLNIGQFAIEYDYDESGVVIKRRYYDLDGNLIKEE